MCYPTFMTASVRILDVTIRDGSYAIQHQYTARQVGAIAGALDAAGIPCIEVGHGCGLGARENQGISAATTDLEQVRAARAAVRSSKIGVLALPAPLTRPENIAAMRADLDFIRIAANADDVAIAATNVAYARQLGLPVWFQMMRSGCVSAKTLCDAARRAEGMGATTVYIVDTTGTLLPDDVARLVGRCKRQGKVSIGFHAHNNLGLAMANTLAAVRAGADCVDATLRGMGRGAGNTQLEALVILLHRLGLAQGIDVDRLLAAATSFIDPIMPPACGISTVDLVSAEANVALYPIVIYERLAGALGIELPQLIRYLGAHAQAADVNRSLIADAIRHFGGDPEALQNLWKPC